MKKKFWIIIGVVLVLVVLVIFLREEEDSWIKDERGVWIKHGNPSETPEEVAIQHNLLDKVEMMYNIRESEIAGNPSMCLGTLQDFHGLGESYVIDIVNVPRTEEDNLEENQCTDYLSGKVTNFIELDKDGNVVRIVD